VINKAKILERRERMMRTNVGFARVRAHAEFDKIWRRGVMSRRAAYQWLAREFGEEEVHIGWMNCEQCQLVVRYSRKLLDDLCVSPDPYVEEDGPRTSREAFAAFRRHLMSSHEQADRINDDTPEEW